MTTENVLEELGVWNKEDAITNLLSHSFKASAAFRQLFLNAMLMRSVPDSDKWQVEVRPAVSGRGIPDLVFYHLAEDGSGSMLIVENKVKAVEGDTQTERYSTAELRQSLQEKFLGPASRLDDVRYTYLTLFGDQPKALGFQAMTYRDLLPAFAQFRDSRAPLAERLIGDWASILTRFYGNEELKDNDVVLERLKRHGELDGGFVYFREMVRSIQLPVGLTVEASFRSNDRGRPHFASCISKQRWQGSIMSEHAPHLGPDCYNIHFEPQFGLLTDRLTMFLHYETNPYQTESWVKKNLPRSQYDAYMQRRQEFVRRLGAKSVEGLEARNRWLQIGTTDFDLRGRTLREVRALVEPWIDRVSRAIDDVIQELTA